MCFEVFSRGYDIIDAIPYIKVGRCQITLSVVTMSSLVVIMSH